MSATVPAADNFLLSPWLLDFCPIFECNLQHVFSFHRYALDDLPYQRFIEFSPIQIPVFQQGHHVVDSVLAVYCFCIFTLQFRFFLLQDCDIMRQQCAFRIPPYGYYTIWRILALLCQQVLFLTLPVTSHSIKSPPSNRKSRGIFVTENLSAM